MNKMSEKVLNSTYEGLNTRQQAFIDAVAWLELETGESPEDEDEPRYNDVSYTIHDIFDVMKDEFDAEPYAGDNDSTWNLKKRRDLIKMRKSYLANKRSDNEGRVRIETDKGSYEGPSKGLDMTNQWIADRPVKSVSKVDDGEDADRDEFEITIRVNREELFRLIREMNEETAREVFNEVME